MNVNPLPKRPSVIIWYKIYCVFMAIGYLAFSAYIAFLLWLPKEQLATGRFATKAIFALEYMWGGILSGTLMLSVFFIAALFLPRKSWVWVYGAIAICVGIPNCCCFPLAIPVLVVWFKPETKNYFGWGL